MKAIIKRWWDSDASLFSALFGFDTDITYTHGQVVKDVALAASCTVIAVLAMQLAVAMS